MKLTYLTSLLIALPLVLTSETSGVPGPDIATPLQIEKTYIPTFCPRLTTPTDTITVDYKGSFTNGMMFDQSFGRRPFTFALGQGAVIKGWDQGLLDMCIGEKRTLTVPPELAYGENGRPPKIPPRKTLIFEVELLRIKGYILPEEKREESKHDEL